MLIEIPLTKGKVALIDNEDFDLVNKYKWYYSHIKNRNTGYALTEFCLNKKRIRIKMHRLILGLTNPKDKCDHIDGNGLNNQKYNLRQCTNAENVRYQKKRKDNTSGYKGVVWHKQIKRWVARIKFNNKSIHIGCFSTIEEAAIAYNKKAQDLFGCFALLNNII